MKIQQRRFSREGRRDALTPSIYGLQFFAWLKTYCFARRNRNFSPGSRIAADASLAWTHVEHAKSPQFNTIALGQRLLHAFEDSFDGHFCFGFGDSGFVYDFVDDVELDHRRLPRGGVTNNPPSH